MHAQCFSSLLLICSTLYMCTPLLVLWPAGNRVVSRHTWGRVVSPFPSPVLSSPSSHTTSNQTTPLARDSQLSHAAGTAMNHFRPPSPSSECRSHILCYTPYCDPVLDSHFISPPRSRTKVPTDPVDCRSQIRYIFQVADEQFLPHPNISGRHTSRFHRMQ